MDLSRLGVGGIQQPEYLFAPVIFPPDGSHQVECWNLFGASELKSRTKVVCWQMLRTGAATWFAKIKQCDQFTFTRD